jgi:hypothetical protein
MVFMAHLHAVFGWHFMNWGETGKV